MIYSRRNWLLFSYLLISVLSFLWSPLLVLLMFVFPLCLFIRFKRTNFLFSIFLVFSFNTLFFIFYMALANLIRIPLYDSTIAAINLVFSVILLLASYKKWKRPLILPPTHNDNFIPVAIIFALFILAFIIRVASIASYPAPILHDPVADAVWTKSLLDNHAITYFYSPGIHLVTGFFSKAASISIPHALNLVTNSFNAFSVLSWGIVTLLLTRKAYLALLVAFLTFVVPVPSMLYVNSGKNALVMAIAFAPLVFYSLAALYKNRSIFSAALFFISLSALFLIHYPTFGYVFLTVLGLFVIPYLPYVKRNQSVQSYRPTRLPWSGIALTIVFLAAWFALQHQGLAENNALSPPINYSQSLSVSFAELKSSIKDVYFDFSGYAKTYSSYYMPIFVVSLVGFFALKRDRFWLVAGLFTFWVGIVPFTIFFLQLSRYNIIESSGVLLFFQVFTLIVALAIYRVSRGLPLETWSRYLYCLIALVIVGWFAYSQFHNYRVRTSELETVNSYDLAAYKWINDSHIKGNFLINEAPGSNRVTYFPTDGGMWIPVYTNHDVSDNFSVAKETIDKNFYSLYHNLSIGQKVGSSLSKLRSDGYSYYYYDRGVFGPPLNPANINQYSSLVYSNPQVSIYKL